VKKDYLPNFTKHPWNIPYNNICLRCKSVPIFHDEKKDIHYSLCLCCLKDTRLGPYHKKLPPVGLDYE